MKTDNEVIAEFMGVKCEKTIGPLSGETYYGVKITPNSDWKICKFDTSWDWLMPVVRKVGEMWNNGNDSSVIEDLIFLPIDSPIDVVYEKTVKAINYIINQQAK